MSEQDGSKIFSAMGRIATFSTELEDALSYAIHHLIDEKIEFTKIITVEQSFSAKISLLLNLYRARHGEDEDFKKLKVITNRASKAQEKRNIVVHSLWRSAGAPDVVTQIKSLAKIKKGYNTNIDNWHHDDFENIWKEFRTIECDLIDCVNELIDSKKAFRVPGA